MIEPLERKGIRVYDCPKCDYTVIGTLEEATKHCNIPLSRGVILPKGFVFGHNYPGKRDEKDTKIMIITSSETVDKSILKGINRCGGLGAPRASRNLTTHDFFYRYTSFCQDSKKNSGKSYWRLYGWEFEYSNILQEDFIKGDYFLLSEKKIEEFKHLRNKKEHKRNEFEKIIPNSQLVRMVEGIESWHHMTS